MKSEASYVFAYSGIVEKIWRRFSVPDPVLIRFWEELPKKTGPGHGPRFGPSAVRRDPPVDDSEAFF